MLRSLTVLGALLVVGCATPTPQTSHPSEPPPPARPAVNLSGYPVEFRQGHTDGCTSATSARVRDETRMKADASYAQGWQDGYDLCSRRRK